MLLQAKAYAYSSTTRTRKKHAKLFSLYDWMSSMVVGVLIVFFIYTFLISSNTVDGQSMEPSFMNNERLFMTPTLYSLKRGDVIILAQDKVEDLNEVLPLCKRVIAMEGDEVDIDFEAGIVHINGQALDEPYVAEPITLVGEDPLEFPVVVPRNSIFVLGDNRNHSRDSRNSSIGMVDKRFIYGKVIMRYWPTDELEFIKNPYEEENEE